MKCSLCGGSVNQKTVKYLKNRFNENTPSCRSCFESSSFEIVKEILQAVEGKMSWRREP